MRRIHIQHAHSNAHSMQRTNPALPDVTCTSVVLLRPSAGSMQASPCSRHSWNGNVPPSPSAQPPGVLQYQNQSQPKVARHRSLHSSTEARAADTFSGGAATAILGAASTPVVG